MFALFLGACSKQIIIGDDSDNALRVSVTNKTKHSITGVSMKLTNDSEFGEQLLSRGNQWEDGQTVSLSYILPSEEEVDASAQEAPIPPKATNDEDVAPTPNDAAKSLFDVRIVMDSNITVTLHAVDFTTIKDASILYDGNLKIAYLEYLGDLGNIENTLEEEKAIEIFSPAPSSETPTSQTPNSQDLPMGAGLEKRYTK